MARPTSDRPSARGIHSPSGRRPFTRERRAWAISGTRSSRHGSTGTNPMSANPSTPTTFLPGTFNPTRVDLDGTPAVTVHKRTQGLTQTARLLRQSRYSYSWRESSSATSFRCARSRRKRDRMRQGVACAASWSITSHGESQGAPGRGGKGVDFAQAGVAIHPDASDSLAVTTTYICPNVNVSTSTRSRQTRGLARDAIQHDPCGVGVHVTAHEALHSAGALHRTPRAPGASTGATARANPTR
ncbi:hypothetical protein C2E23DRAFT_299243 [Lenzites betulinus]|nr:hypothetical protein C2E23DRAFT_299243 [Lenzites betulinus]